MSAQELPLVMPDLVMESEGQPPQLIGTVCTACGHYAYPVVEDCSECGQSMQQVALGSRGTIYSYTTVRVKPPLGLPRPYSAAYIDLDEAPLRIYALLDGEEDFAIGQPVELRLGELGNNNDGEPCRRPYFSSPG